MKTKKQNPFKPAATQWLVIAAVSVILPFIDLTYVGFTIIANTIFLMYEFQYRLWEMKYED